MIRAVYRDGVIQPLDELPREWQEGEALEVRDLKATGDAENADKWIYEEGIHAGDNHTMPPQVRAELARRLAELHHLGPMEFDSGQREEAQAALQEMNHLSRLQMQQLADRQS